MSLNFLLRVKKKIQTLFSLHDTQKVIIKMTAQISQENLVKMQDRLSFISTVINEQSRRIHHSAGIAKEYGPQIVQASIQDLLKEKVTLELQIDTLSRLLTE